MLFVVNSVCPSVCHKLKIDSSFFVSRIAQFFGRQFCMIPCTKRCSSIFWFRPPNAQNLLPKIAQNRLSRLVCHIDRRCLALLGGFREWPIQWNHAKCCGADRCCHGKDVWPRRGDSVAYRLVCYYVSMCVCAGYRKVWWISIRTVQSGVTAPARRGRH